MLHADPLGNPKFNEKRVRHNTDALSKAESGMLPSTLAARAAAVHHDDGAAV